ncbi:MAG TPA: efflux RND transporter periplasmic adaptor subunit, partial [Chthonomonadaceae bacterium]|nr:efflux RND transporter periplasmic adaptor subunit [Chthonomonadaceae bacterium]
SDPTSTVPHTGLFGIARTDVMRIQVQVPQSFLSSLRAGQQARVLIQEYPGKVFTGTVFHTSGALDATSRTLLAEVRVNNPDNVLIPGMYAQIQLESSRAKPLLRIPSNTLIFDMHGTRVMTVTKDGRIRFQPIVVGRDYGSEVDVREGLEGSERLVTNPTDDLKEGQQVRVVSEQQ